MYNEAAITQEGFVLVLDMIKEIEDETNDIKNLIDDMNNEITRMNSLISDIQAG